MIVCQRCGKENQDHYKFCLGCGAEISAAAGESGVGMMKTMMADAGDTNEPVAPGGAPKGPPPGVGLPTPPSGMPAQQAHPHGGNMGQAPMGQPPIAAGGPLKCQQCQADIPPNFKFCGVCGTPIPLAPEVPVHSPAPAQHAAPALHATMTLIRPDGNEGGTHTLHMGLNKIGRSHGAIFETDGYLSPTHADLTINEQGNHVICDLGSLNGVFVRMTEEEELRPGQIIRIGQELLRFDLIESAPLGQDGTEVMGSPNPGYWGRVTVIIGEDVTGAAYPLLGDAITMGREHGDINFPDDGYVSGMHARLVTRDNRVFLSDMGSSNGTFMKLTEERQIPNNSYVLLGQQLFRITVQ